MDSPIAPLTSFWPQATALFLAVIVPLILWCIYAFRIRQITARSVVALAATEIAALVAIAILARY
jgi:hypothetical protein